MASLCEIVDGLTPSHGAASRRFSVGADTLHFDSTSSSLLDALENFFTPYVVAQGTGPGGQLAEPATWTAIHTEDDRLQRRLLDALPADPDRRITAHITHDREYTLDHYTPRDLRHEILVDPKLRLVYVAPRDGGSIHIVSRRDSYTWVALLRVIRDTWSERVLRSGRSLLVHGCAMERAGRGILIAGDKRAGKTTSLLSLATTLGYDIVANDRLFLTTDETGSMPRVVGIPTVIQLRAETVERFPAVASLAEDDALYVQTLADALGVGVAREARANAIVFMQYEASRAEPRIEPLSSARVAVELERNLFPTGCLDYLAPIGAIPSSAAPASQPVAAFETIPAILLSCDGSSPERLAQALDRHCQRSS